MLKRLSLAAGFALAVLALSPSVGRAQAGPGVTLESQNAPLSHVVAAFEKLSSRTIVVAADVGDPLITASVANVQWERALDLILATRGLVARVDASGIIRIEKLKG
jgi:type II secretory pathway component HofQ